MDEDIEALDELVGVASNIVVLTGAGISTESGIPDFRSPGGIWSKFKIVQYADYMTSEDARTEDWRRRFFMRDQMGEVFPNSGHEVLARWVMAGKCSAIITQNIDGLHQEAGTPVDSVIEIHGTGRHAICVDCAQRHELSQCREQFEETQESPRCIQCSGILKSAVVMFGEPMPEGPTKLAFEAAANADLFIAIGSSLVVFPAANIPLQAKKAGAKLVIINREPTEMDQVADLVVNAEIGKTLSCLTPV